MWLSRDVSYILGGSLSLSENIGRSNPTERMYGSYPSEVNSEEWLVAQRLGYCTSRLRKNGSLTYSWSVLVVFGSQDVTEQVPTREWVHDLVALSAAGVLL
jgi:CTP:phosphocholine cytidylyltransferase-like protein